MCNKQMPDIVYGETQNHTFTITLNDMNIQIFKYLGTSYSVLRSVSAKNKHLLSISIIMSKTILFKSCTPST
jgi:hypothetical protein